MKKKEFMDELKEALAGCVPPEVYYDTVQYYEDYFRRQMKEGKSEEEITKALGSGRVVAKTIIETSGGDSGSRFYEMPDDKKRKQDRYSDDDEKNQKGWHINVDENGNTSFAFGKLDFGTVLGKVVLAFCLLIILAVIIFLVMVGLNVLIYVAVPVGLILLIVYLITSLTGRR